MNGQRQKRNKQERRMSFKQFLTYLRYAGYILILLAESFLGFNNFSTSAQENSFITGCVGIVYIIILTWVFLEGLQAINIRSKIGWFSVWVVGVVFMVWGNWGWVQTSILTQSQQQEKSIKIETFNHEIEQEKTRLLLQEKSGILDRQKILSKWSAEYTKNQDRIKEIDLALKPVEKEEKKQPEAVQKNQSLVMFEKMSFFGLSPIETGKYYWLLGLILLQILAAIAAPRGKEKSSYFDYIERWVFINWAGIRQGVQETIISKERFFDYCQKRGIDIPDQIYQEIFSKCQKLRILDGEKVLIKNESEVIKCLKK